MLVLGSIVLYAMDLPLAAAVAFGGAAVLSTIFLYAETDRDNLDQSVGGQRENPLQISDRHPSLSSWHFGALLAQAPEREDSKLAHISAAVISDDAPALARYDTPVTKKKVTIP